MAIKWNINLAVGVAEIDSQHQELFERMNQLLEACNHGKGKQAVGDMISFLESYVVEHFSAEEKLQISSGYPEYAGHKAMHAECLSAVANLRKQLDQHGPTLPFVISVNKTVVDWLTTHISRADRSLGLYLQNAK